MRFQAFPYLGDGGVLFAVFLIEIISEFVSLSFVVGETSATGVFGIVRPVLPFLRGDISESVDLRYLVFCWGATQVHFTSFKVEC